MDWCLNIEWALRLGWLWRIMVFAAAAAKSLQSCLTLCDPMDGSPPASPVPGILQARTLEWVAISFSDAWKLKVKVKSLSRVRLLATPWTAAYQAPPSMGFSRQECWSGVSLPSPYIWATLFKSNEQNGITLFATMWMDLAIIPLSEVNQRKTSTIYQSHVKSNWKMIQMSLFVKQKQTQRFQKQIYDYQWGRRGV